MNDKILSLDKIKNIPIDDIINLYRNGYRLEEVTPESSQQLFGQQLSGNSENVYTMTPDPVEIWYAQGYEQSDGKLTVDLLIRNHNPSSLVVKFDFYSTDATPLFMGSGIACISPYSTIGCSKIRFTNLIRKDPFRVYDYRCTTSPVCSPVSCTTFSSVVDSSYTGTVVIYGGYIPTGIFGDPNYPVPSNIMANCITCDPSWTCVKDSYGNNTGDKYDSCTQATVRDTTMCPLPSLTPSQISLSSSKSSPFSKGDSVTFYGILESANFPYPDINGIPVRVKIQIAGTTIVDTYVSTSALAWDRNWQYPWIVPSTYAGVDTAWKDVTVTASFAGNSSYLSSTNTKTYTITAPASITANKTTVASGGSVTFTGSYKPLTSVNIFIEGLIRGHVVSTVTDNLGNYSTSGTFTNTGTSNKTVQVGACEFGGLIYECVGGTESSLVTITITPACSSISLNASKTTAIVGESIILTATANPTSTSFLATFKRDTTIIGTGCNTSTTNGQCQITWDTTGLTAGTYSVTVRVIVEGVAQCTSSPQPIILNPPPVTCTAISVSPSKTTAIIGDVITLTATVQPTNTSFPVTFKIDGTVLPVNCSTVALTGMCSVDWITTGMTAGIHNVTAVTGQCTSTIVQVTLSSPVTCTAISVVADKTTATIGTSIKLTATVLPTNTSFPVTFKIDGVVLPSTCNTSTTDGKCYINWDTIGKIAKNYSITAEVTGKCGPGTPITVTLTAPVVCTSVSVSPSKTTAIIGDVITLTATVQPTNTSFPVTFKVNGVALIPTCSTSITNGQCPVSWDTSGLTAGNYTITAEATGCTNPSSPITVTLSTPSISCTSVSVIADKPTATVGATIYLTATVEPKTTSFPVIFKADSITLTPTCNTSTVDGTCKVLWATAGLTAKSYSITAEVTGKCGPSSPVTVILTSAAACTSVENVAASPTTANVGETVTLTTVVQPITSTFTIEFKYDSNVIGSVNTISGIASYPWNTTVNVAGTYNIKAYVVGTTCQSTIATPVTLSTACTPVWICEQPLNGYESDGCGHRRANPICNATCTPNWQCEIPLNGYESDGCGNRRLSSACNPDVCTPNWQCEQPLNGYENDGCGNRRLNTTCNPTCVPNWQCEQPLNSYENDGCGNRRPNPLCAPAGCIPNWQCEQPLNGYENDGCGNRRPNTTCALAGCVPRWQCEQPLNGYESDGCGNRRLNPACAPPCIPNWVCEQPLNGYESDGCGNRRLNTACAPPPVPTAGGMGIAIVAGAIAAAAFVIMRARKPSPPK